MIKRTLYFGNPAYLSQRNEQLVINLPNAKGLDNLSGNTVPIEDIGVVILDHQQITITHSCINKLLKNNAAFIICDDAHLPAGMLLNLNGHTLQSSKFRCQTEATEPLKKQLWQQTIKAKIANQAAHLIFRGKNAGNLKRWSTEVKSGDPENMEARAAVYYWKSLFHQVEDFKRAREGLPPNHLLNYGYALLRGAVARALTGSGLLPTFGIHHRNQYNAYCLADDIMEPYRPFVDKTVFELVDQNLHLDDITTDIKRELFQILTMDVQLDNEKSPLMIAVQRTTASLCKCYEGKGRKILFPEFC